MRAVDAWAIETRGVPSLELMETAGRAVAEAAAEAAALGARRRRLRQGQQRRRRAGRRAGPGRDGLRGRGAAAVAGRRALGRRQGEPRALPPPRAARCRRRARPVAERGERDRRRDLRNRLLGRAPRPRRRRDRGDQRLPRRRWSPPTSPRASTPRAARSRAPRSRPTLTVSFHAAKVGHWISPGKRHTGELRVVPIGIPDGAPAERRGGPDRPVGAGAAAQAGGRVDQVQLGPGGGRGRLARADRRGLPLGRRRDPLRRRLRDRRRAGRPRADLRGEADRGDVGRLREPRGPAAPRRIRAGARR